MAEVRIVLADEDYEGQVIINVDFQPDLPATEAELTPAQTAALQMLMFAHNELFGETDDGQTLGGAIEETLGG